MTVNANSLLSEFRTENGKRLFTDAQAKILEEEEYSASLLLETDLSDGVEAALLEIPEKTLRDKIEVMKTAIERSGNAKATRRIGATKTNGSHRR